jgi:indole-3-glycerol phosphate synthase
MPTLLLPPEPTGVLAAIARRKRWEGEVLRDALRGQLRVSPDSPWLPAADVLATGKRLLRAGGRDPDTESREGRDPPGGPPRAFAGALREERRLSVIAELKRKSPSRGAMADWKEPEPLAEAFAEAGAAALSVLTDEPHFDGRPGFLPRTRARFPGPVLRKDFLLDELDLAVSAALGADAVLLIVALLGPGVGPLLRLCDAYALAALVEVHHERELDLALAAAAPVIGVNNRDLGSFRVSLGTTERLAARVPAATVLVAESGIAGERDALRMRRAGADAVLVGEKLAGRPFDAARARDGVAALRVEAPRGSQVSSG